MAPQDEGNSYKKRDRNGVWESSSTERAAGIVKASRDYAAHSYVGVCGREALPRARMRWGEMKSKGQAAFYPTRQNSKGETCGGCTPSVFTGTKWPPEGRENGGVEDSIQGAS